MSMTSIPVSSKPHAAPPLVVKPPVLASDILREEVAPIAPGKRLVRIALGAFAATFAIGALAARVPFGAIQITAPSAFEGSVAIATLAALAAAVRLPYAFRAWLAAALGLLPLLLGVIGLGPLAALGAEGSMRAALTIPMVTLLPAALVFRARYRAFREARVILAIALAASLPALALLVMTALDPAGSLGDRATATLAVASGLTALFGFMGPETTAGCSQWAAFVVIAQAARPMRHAVVAAWDGDAPTMTAFGAGALGELIASMVVTFAVFQIFAAALGGKARQVDVHQIVGAGKPSRSGEEPSEKDRE
jgi:hypothetical protein